MSLSRRSRYGLFALVLYLTLCTIGGINRRRRHAPPRPPPAHRRRNRRHARLRSHPKTPTSTDASITTPDNITLRAWTIHPHHPNGDTVLLLHGLGDNRLGMTGYAQLLLAHGFTVLLPDARATDQRRPARHLRPPRAQRHPSVDRLSQRPRSSPLHLRPRRIHGRRTTPAVARHAPTPLRRSRRIFLLQFS